jgi:hypothetical protein
MDAYTTRIKANAENLAKEVFPKKALELDDLINVLRPKILITRHLTHKNIWTKNF